MQKRNKITTEKVVGFGPNLFKSLSGYPNSGGTRNLHYCDAKFKLICLNLTM